MDKTRKHWIVTVIAALLMSGAIGLNINTLGVFLQPIALSLNIQMGDISMHSTLISLGMAFAAFFVAPVIEKVNFRVVVSVSTLIVILATVGFAFSSEVWMFNVLGLIRGISSSFFGIVAVQMLINNWFIEKNGRVTSLVFSFSGIAGALLSPLFANIIEANGWRVAYLVQAVLFVIFSLPAILINFRFKPEDEGLVAYGMNSIVLEDNSKENVLIDDRKPYHPSSLPFILLLIISVGVTGLTGMAQHLSGMGIDFGFSANISAYMISAAMMGNIVFKLVIGTLSDLKGTMTSIVTMIGIVIIGLLCLIWNQNQYIVLLGSLLFGAVYGVASVGFSLLAKHLFNEQDFIKVFPKVNFMSNIGAAVAVSLYGYSYDLSGGYTLALIGSITISIVGLVLIILANTLSKK